MKMLKLVDERELKVIEIVRKIDAIEDERAELVSKYDKFIRVNGFKNFDAAANYEGNNELSKRIDAFEEKLYELADKAEKMKNEIGLNI